MREVIATTRKRLILLILLTIFSISGVMYFGLQYASLTQINTTIGTDELHQHVQDNPALHDYVVSQKEYEAHFITLANKVRSEDARKISEVVAVFAVASIATGSLLSVLLIKTLMRPVIEAHQSQERFLQDAAHELRNPLAVLSVSLQQYDSSKDTKRLVETFRRQTKRLVGITEDLLFLERKNRGKPEIQNLKELLQDIVDELHPLAAKSKIALKLQSDDISKTIVTADYVRMMKNIIDNAIKYSPRGKTVHIAQSLEKSNIKIVVSDNGIGIPPEQLQDIGKRFYRASNAGTIDGTGLGIAIVKKLVNLYSGTFQITSSSDGTVVTIVLPK